MAVTLSVDFTAVQLSMLIFWVVTQSGLAGRYQHFGGTYCIRLQGFRISAYKFTGRYNPED
jgi:hypothetical protein